MSLTPKRERNVFLNVVFVFALAVSLSALMARPVHSDGLKLAKNWRVFFIPDEYRSGNYICHSGRGEFQISKDLSVTGQTKTWNGSITAELVGRVDAKGQLSGELRRDGAVGGRSSGALRNNRGSGVFEEFHSGCRGTWVSEPKPRQRLTRPKYAEPSGCRFSGKRDQRICEYELPDGTQRQIVQAQDLFSRTQFKRAFGGAPPGYDRPDLAREALTAFFWIDVPEGSRKDSFERFQDTRELPYGALACLEYGYRVNALVENGNQLTVQTMALLCFQPMKNDGSRFTLLQIFEKKDTQNDARFKRDASAVLQSLRLP